MKQFDFEVIGTHLSITVDTSLDCTELFQDIQMQLCEFEVRFSRFLSGNWLHTLNTSRRGSLDLDGKNMLSYMLEVAAKTDGYFDPTVSKRLAELGYGNNNEYNFGERRFGDYRDVEVIGDEVLLHGDILLEFGGVGKGYLIDVIQEMIGNGLCHIDRNSPVSVADEVGISCSENGAGFLGSAIAPLEMTETRYLINFGGDLYGRGGWKVGLESPFAPDEVIGTHILHDGFLACSAGTRRKWGNHHHLINPKTGESATEVIASYVEGLSGMVVDAYATTLCVMPWGLARETLSKTPEISGVVVRYDGTIFQKEGSASKIFS